MPNITGKFAVGNTQSPPIDPIGQGAFEDHGISGGTVGSAFTPAGTYYDFDASRSNSLYRSDTDIVIPASILVMFAIKY